MSAAGFGGGAVAVEEMEDQRVQYDGDDGTGQDQFAAFLGQDIQGDAETGEDEGEFADLGEAGGDGERRCAADGRRRGR